MPNFLKSTKDKSSTVSLSAVSFHACHRLPAPPKNPIHKPQEEGRSSPSLHLMAAAMAPALSIFSSPFFAYRPQAFPTTTVFCSYSVNFSPTSFHSLKRFNTAQRTRKNFVPKADDGDGDGDVSDYYEMVDEEIEEVDNKRDYDVEYEPLSAVGGAHGEGEIAMVDSKTFVSTQGWESETIVDYRIDEDEFHKISLLDCDFFIRKPPDPDNDVYDFREMYVTPPDTDVYAIPKVLAPMPQKYIRCAQSDYGCYNVTEPPIDAPRDPLYKSEREVLKVFLFKHYKNRRLDDPEFVLDLEEIYVIDSKTKSITRAKVLVTVPEGKNRDRKRDLLKVRDGGTSFKIIDPSEREDPATVIEKEEWAKTRLEMERHLSKLRDFDKSNWF